MKKGHTLTVQTDTNNSEAENLRVRNKKLKEENEANLEHSIETILQTQNPTE